MAWWRHSRLAKAVVVVLLLWTAADLTNSSLCALENEDMRSSAPAAPGSSALDESHGQIPPQPVKQHIDDCFCCSHCVDVQARIPALASVPVNSEVQKLVLAAPRLFGYRLYHPPLV